MTVAPAEAATEVTQRGATPLAALSALARDCEARAAQRVLAIRETLLDIIAAAAATTNRF